MKLNPIAVVFWLLCGLLAFGLGAGSQGIALTVAAAMTFSALTSILLP
jgi:hypothetical protein